LPDAVETLNEPDGDWEQLLSPEQYATFIELLRQGLLTWNVGGDSGVHLLGPGLAVAPGAIMPYVLPFIDAGALSDFEALSAHPYFVPYGSSTDPANTIYNSVSVVQEPDFAAAVAAGRDVGVPFFATEFGGKLSALTLKGALDVMRAGASAAAIWDMAGDSYALIDINPDGGAPIPQPAYFPMASLVPNIPSSSTILDSTSTGGADGGADLLASPGFAAFAANNQVTVGVANPSDQYVWVTLNFPGAGALVFNNAYSFQAQGVVQNPMTAPTQGCPVTVGLPPSAGVVLTATQETP
jgi:hypothetical protein